MAEQGFELGEDLFNRVEVGGVGRQEAQRGPHPLNGGPHGGTLVAAQIVHNDDIARRERWQQTLFDIGQEAGTVHRAIEDTRSRKSVVVQRRHEGQRLPVTVGPGRAQPLAPGAAAMTAGHVRLGPGLIEEHEPARIKLALRALPHEATTGRSPDCGPSLNPTDGILAGRQNDARPSRIAVLRKNGVGKGRNMFSQSRFLAGFVCIIMYCQTPSRHTIMYCQTPLFAVPICAHLASEG